MSLRDRIFKLATGVERTGIYPLGFDDYLSYFTFGGIGYNGGGPNTTMGMRKQEEIGSNFRSLAELAYKRNGVVFACVAVRMLMFSEARFQWRRLSSGRPGEMWGDKTLSPLEHPWHGATTGDLLARAELDNSLAGNAFFARRPGAQIKRMRPDWTTIILGSYQDPDIDGFDLDAEVLGYAYLPGGPSSGRDIETYTRDEVAHFAPIPDPTASFRGMSWLTPVIQEIMADKATTEHKLDFFEHAATTNLMVKIDPSIRTPEKFTDWVKAYKAEHEGKDNRYKTLFLGGGSDATAIGANLQEADFKAVQGAGETRIAAASGVPPVIVGLSEGLAAATYANYASARRRMMDMTMRPLWRNFAGSMSVIVPPPTGSELWYDDRDVPALRENEEDAAGIAMVEAQTIKTYIDAGYKPESVVAAVKSGDLSKLEHTGLFSVQLQPPNTEFPAGKGVPTPPVPPPPKKPPPPPPPAPSK